MGKGLVIGAVVVVAIIGVGAFAMLANSNEAQVRIEVQSLNVLNDLEVFVYVDGDLIGHETMKSSLKGSSVHFDRTVKFQGDSKTITIKAISQGGSLGTLQDSTQLIVFKDCNYTVRLTI